MKGLTFFSLFLTVLAITGCQQRPYDAELDELRKSQIVRVTYHFEPSGPEAWKTWNLDEEKTDKILAKLAVRGQEKGMLLAMQSRLQVTFIKRDGCMVETQFVKPDQLEWAFWGQIYLKDDSFYKAICALVSASEGKPFDPLSGGS